MSLSLTSTIDLVTAPPSTSPDLSLKLLQHLWDVADIVFGDITELLSEYHLTQTQITLLWALEPSTPPVPMRELARRLRCDPSNITLLGDQLQAAGLVERQPDPTDGRRRVVRLTEHGLELWALLLERTRQRSPLFTLSIREQAQLLRLLEKIELNNQRLPTGFLATAK